MRLVWSSDYGNPSSVHREGEMARRRLEEGRDSIARSLGALSEEIFFTSGGTESNNWAVHALFALGQKGAVIDSGKITYTGIPKKRVIISSIEHPSILKTCEQLRREGAEVVLLPVDQYGLVSASSLEKALSDDTAFVSIMYANNEIGTIEPVKELSEIAHAHGVLFHTDAVQAVGSLAIDAHDLGVDALSFSAHKFGGPTGTGGLFIRSGIKFEPFIVGGGQEYGHRAGTENLAGVIGMAKALELAYTDFSSKKEEMISIRDHLIAEVLKTIPGSHLSGHPSKRLPGNAHFTFDMVDGEALLLYLNLKGYACSSGSACTSKKAESSHVLSAIGLNDNVAKSALRISIGRDNTEEEVLSIVPVLDKIISDLRSR